MSGVGGTTPAGFEQYALASREPEAKKSELGQDEFLKLMLTQIKYQDPMKPMENGEFIGQMAQFSTVSGIEQMQLALEELSGAYGSSQTLQASQLVGREIMIEGSTIRLEPGEDGEPGEAAGRFTLDASSGDVTLDIENAGGVFVRRVSLGAFEAGTHDFRWDGRGEDGEPLVPGNYVAKVTAAGTGEEPIALPVLVARTVDSVEFAPGGLVKVNTLGGEDLSLGDIRQISERRPG